MIRFSQNILSYTSDLGQSDFVAHELTYDATLRNLELIGEAASRVPDEIRTEHSQVPWRLIIATRNRLIHAYLDIDNDTVWSIIQDDIPTLLSALEDVRKRAP